MASVYDLKPAFQNILRPICRSLAGWGVTANQVTVVAALISVAAGTLIAFRPSPLIFLLVPVVLIVRMALNAIDGMLAREHGMKSNLGAILNELGDVIGDAALYLPFALLDGCRPSLVVAIVLLAVVTEMTGIMAVQIGATRRYDGPMGKSDRAFAFGAISLALGVGIAPGPWLDGLLILVLALLVITVVNRARRALQEAKP